MPLSAFLKKAREAKDEAALFRAFREYADRYDADVIVYNVLIENLHHVARRQSSIYFHAPPQWVKHYAEHNYFADDPVMRAAMKAHDAFHWYDCGAIIPLNETQKHYLQSMRECGLVDGLAIPVRFGLGSAAFFAIGSTKNALDLSSEQICEMWCACLHAHNRSMELRGKYPQQEAGLSKRETQVLTLVAKGKSNSAIAKTLGVSDHTIDTLVRRSFAKLGVSDRISAALKAVGSGAVQI